MASESKSFAQPSIAHSSLGILPAFHHANALTVGCEIGLIYGLILVAIWSPQGHFNTILSAATAIATIVLGFRGRTFRQLGLARPLSGAFPILALGGLFVGLIMLIGSFTRSVGPPQALPWNRAWQYAIWAVLQQFILQSFLYLRLERLMGPQRAVLCASGLFALAHIPNPLLALLSLLGALFFCEMFRRYRNLFPLGVVHAALGLTIASSLPDHWLHHMRVGLGYLTYHP
jgi:membrane protease YdiL (CAAX protease family)